MLLVGPVRNGGSQWQQLIDTSRERGNRRQTLSHDIGNAGGWESRAAISLEPCLSIGKLIKPP